MRTTALACPEHPDCVVALVTDKKESGRRSVKAPWWVTEWLQDHPNEVLYEIVHAEARPPKDTSLLQGARIFQATKWRQHWFQFWRPRLPE